MNCPTERSESCDERIDCMVAKKCLKHWAQSWGWKLGNRRTYKLLTLSNSHAVLKKLTFASCWHKYLNWSMMRMYLLQLLVLGLVERHGRFYSITPLGRKALSKLNSQVTRDGVKTKPWPVPTSRKTFLLRPLESLIYDYRKQTRVEVAVKIDPKWLQRSREVYW